MNSLIHQLINIAEPSSPTQRDFKTPEDLNIRWEKAVKFSCPCRFGPKLYFNLNSSIREIGHRLLLSNLLNTATRNGTFYARMWESALKYSLKTQKHISGHVTTRTQRQCAALHINLFSCQGLTKILSTCLAVCPGGGMRMWQGVVERGRSDSGFVCGERDL